MNITINGVLGADATKSSLEKQLEKTKVIEEFCKKNNIKELNYKDAELEYSCKITATTTVKKTTGGGKNNE